MIGTDGRILYTGTKNTKGSLVFGPEAKVAIELAGISARYVCQGAISAPPRGWAVGECHWPATRRQHFRPAAAHVSPAATN